MVPFLTVNRTEVGLLFERSLVGSSPRGKSRVSSKRIMYPSKQCMKNSSGWT
jgi:hypothetical protein